MDSTHAIEYDETLLAVVGILDEVKFQSNVASWIKASGLWGPYPTQDSADVVHASMSKGSEDVAASSDSGSVDSGRFGEGRKKRRDAAVVLDEAAFMDGFEHRGSLDVTTNEKHDRENSPETPLWFDNPPTMRHWVGRGRKVLAALGIPIEHGLLKH